MFKFLKRFKLKSVQAGDGQRSVDNIDAMTAAAQNRGIDPTGGGAPALFPPDYVKDDDDGRPRH
jgi:hypothetical protein